MALGRINLSVVDARGLAEGALRGIGFDDNEARIVADHVVDTALCGYEYSGLEDPQLAGERALQAAAAAHEGAARDRLLYRL